MNTLSVAPLAWQSPTLLSHRHFGAFRELSMKKALLLATMHTATYIHPVFTAVASFPHEQQCEGVQCGIWEAQMEMCKVEELASAQTVQISLLAVVIVYRFF